MQLSILFLCVLAGDVAYAHNHELAAIPATDLPTHLAQWFGQFHVIFLHFPIVLILMAALTELLFIWRKDSLYDRMTSFLLIAAAILVIPTVISGWAFEEGIGVDESNPIFWWHRFFGIATLVLTFLTLLFRFYGGRHVLYYLSFLLLVISVLVASHFGGVLAFGAFNFLP